MLDHTDRPIYAIAWAIRMPVTLGNAFLYKSSDDASSQNFSLMPLAGFSFTSVSQLDLQVLSSQV